MAAVGALGSLVTFLGTVTIIPFFPNAWAAEAGGFPAMYLPVAFLMKDFLFLAASFYLLKQDLTRAAWDSAESRLIGLREEQERIARVARPVVVASRATARR